MMTAFLCYRHGMVVRIGGSSSSVSCFSVTNGLYKLITTTDTSELGGDMFTELIADHFAKDFLRYVLKFPLARFQHRM